MVGAFNGVNSMIHKCATSLILGVTLYIPPDVSFVLCRQLSPTQMKCTCDANDSTYILYRFLIKMREILASVL